MSHPPVSERPQHAPARTDAAAGRERRRQRRLARLALLLAPVGGYLWWHLLTGDPVPVGLPSVDPLYVMTGTFFLVLIGTLVGTTFASGRSPHVVIRPEQIDVRLDDVKGLHAVREDVLRSVELLLSARTFRATMGGTPRRGLLFEGPPGTGKTHLAKAMAAEAGVPFLFVSATSFQSMYYGATARKIRSYFTALRKAARAEGAAIGFIEEIDAIALARGGMSLGGSSSTASALSATATASGQAPGCGGLVGLPFAPPEGSAARDVVARSVVSEGVGGVVNELLVQMQSFDVPTGWQRAAGTVVDAVNRWLPASRQVPRPRVEPVDVLLIAATNRADNLDPALLRPGRFDRRLAFEAPDKAGRRELVDHFLARKAHDPELDDPEHRDALAGVTTGYTPAQIEHLLDEGLVNALRRGGAEMTWRDVEHARLVHEVGLGRPVGYTDHEKRLIATHEAGHATVAWLVAPQRRLEILTIVKRSGSLGLLAHGDRDDVYTRSKQELKSLICIAMAGQVAEDLFFGDVSTGPGGDLSYATTVAVQMVGQAGMGDSLVSFAAVPSGVGDPGLVGRVLDDRRGRQMVEEILTEQRGAARLLLGSHLHLVEALRDELLARHELIGSQITAVLRAAQDRHEQRLARRLPVVDLRAAQLHDRPDPSAQHP